MAQQMELRDPFNLNEVAAGDDRDFSPALEGTYRVEQKVTVVPFKEVSAERILDYSMSPGYQYTTMKMMFLTLMMVQSIVRILLCSRHI